MAVPPEETPEYSRLALDVASVIIERMLKRSEAVSGKLGVKRSGPADPMSQLRAIQEQLAKITTAHEAAISTFANRRADEKQDNAQAHLKELLGLIEALLSELSAPQPPLNFEMELAQLQLLCDQIIDENESLEEKLRFRDQRIQEEIERGETNLTAGTWKLSSALENCGCLLDAAEAKVRQLQQELYDLKKQQQEQTEDFRSQVKTIVGASEQEIKTLLGEIADLAHLESSANISGIMEELKGLFALQSEEISKLTAEAEALKESQQLANKSLQDLNNALHEALERNAALEAALEQSEEQRHKRVASLLEENEEIVAVLNEANAKRVTELQEHYKGLLREREAEAELLRSELASLNERLVRVENECAALREEKRRAPVEEFLRNHDSIGLKRQRLDSSAGDLAAKPASSLDYSNLTIQAQVRIVFTGYRDATGPKSVKHLGGLVEKLGGVVHISDVFSDQITHVVAPKGCSSIKVLAGSLTAKWLMNEDWLLESSAEGYFLPESQFNGRRYTEERPFRSKTFYMTSAFQAQQLRHQFDISCCRTLIENLGKGRLVREQGGVPPDYTLIADGEHASEHRITLKTFLHMIPGYGGK